MSSLSRTPKSNTNSCVIQTLYSVAGGIKGSAAVRLYEGVKIADRCKESMTMFHFFTEANITIAIA